uniref:Chaperonin 10 n=1 Tax=Phocoena sinus TaxID=42100 RepID=A0A8C9BGP2_PHOSS
MAGQAFRKFLPVFDRVLVERSAAETVTKGGIMLPEKSQGKVLQATVVAVRSGSKGKGGEIQPDSESSFPRIWSSEIFHHVNNFPVSFIIK